jgi:hypothetical protein
MASPKAGSAAYIMKASSVAAKPPSGDRLRAATTTRSESEQKKKKKKKKKKNMIHPKIRHEQRKHTNRNTCARPSAFDT